jgi:hypothetical protein
VGGGEGEERVWEDEYGATLLKLSQEWGEGGITGSGGEGEFKYDRFDIL